MINKVKNFLWPLAFGVALIMALQFGLFHKIPKALTDCGVTISGALIGLIIGSLLGFMIAAIATFFPKWGYGGMIVVTALNAVPIVALSPIMNLWFSTGMQQKIGVVTVVCMAAMRSRTNRPQGGATVLLQGRVPESVRDVAREAAGASGISIAAYLEALVLTDAEKHFVRPVQQYRQEAISA